MPGEEIGRNYMTIVFEDDFWCNSRYLLLTLAENPRLLYSIRGLRAIRNRLCRLCVSVFNVTCGTRLRLRSFGIFRKGDIQNADVSVN